VCPEGTRKIIDSRSVDDTRGKGRKRVAYEFFVFVSFVFFFSARHTGTGNNDDAAISRCKVVIFRVTFSLDELRLNEIVKLVEKFVTRCDGLHKIEVERSSFSELGM